jgi:hypothetical protein
MQQKQGTADCYTTHLKVSEMPIDGPHRPWLQKSTARTPAGQKLGSLWCELLRHTHPGQYLCGTGRAPEAVSDLHPYKGLRCHNSSLGTCKEDLFIHMSRSCKSYDRFPQTFGLTSAELKTRVDIVEELAIIR